MPTPSSDPPDESPTSHNTSTCPEDLQYPALSTQEAENEGRASSGDEASQSSSDAGGDRDRPVEDAALLEVELPHEPSPRSTTTSPQVHANTTGVNPLAPVALDVDLVKAVDATDIDHPSPSSRASSLRSRVPLEQTRSSTDHDDDYCPDTMDADESCLPSMGPEFPSMGPDFPSMRSIPIPLSSYLRPGSRFHGTQQSERQVYDVQVEIKHVDLRESFLCGYLRIQGLTEDHPTLTTYFEGEIIGSKYGFVTKHDEWGANTKVDLSHWAKFSAFRPFLKQARKGPVTVADAPQREHIFMRWKEHFLVPDHRVRTISGASFEGFYYICFNQVKGEVSGIYFHSRSERFQQLELRHVPDRGCFSAQEYR